MENISHQINMPNFFLHLEVLAIIKSIQIVR